MSIISMQRRILFVLAIALFVTVWCKNSYALDLNVNGLFQLQYENTDGEKGTEKVNELFIRRLKLTFSGRVTENINLIIEPEFGVGEPRLKDALLEYKKGSNEIRAGNHLVPIGAESLVNDNNLILVERSLTSQISPERNVGVSILWKTLKEKLSVQGGFWTSNFNTDAESNLIDNRLDENQIFATNFAERGNNLLIGAARVDYASSGFDRSAGYSYKHEIDKLMAFGVSYYTTVSSSTDKGPLQDEVTGFKNSSANLADFFIRRQPIDFELGYGVRSLDWWQYSFSQFEPVSVSSTQTSYFAQLYYSISSTFAGTARYEFFEYDSQNNILKGKLGQNDDTWTTIGINYNISKHSSGVQLNYILKDEGMPSGESSKENDTILIQTTVSF